MSFLYPQMVIDGIGRRLAMPDTGITFVQFHYRTNIERQYILEHGSVLGAGGVTVPTGDPRRITILLYDTSQFTREHEMGHALFLPHATGHTEGASEAAGSDASYHDNDAPEVLGRPSPFPCHMSYDISSTSFCGTCQLRLRGWNPLTFSVDGRRNSR